MLVSRHQIKMPQREVDVLDQLIKAAKDARLDGIVARMLRVIREHLRMDAAFISQFVDDSVVIREFDGPGWEAPISRGDIYSAEETYCKHVLEGRLPQLIPDTGLDPFAASMVMTRSIPIGRHISVPITMPDGSIYGMLCCAGSNADQSLRERDLQILSAFAELTAFEINKDLESTKSSEEMRLRICDVMSQGQMAIVVQPIFDVATKRPISVECLARFSALPARTPDKWFQEAAQVGLGVELEMTAMRLAHLLLPKFPPAVRVGVNVSPSTVLSQDFTAALEGMEVSRLVLEITEHAYVVDYGLMLAALRPLRDRGLQIAVDDAGAGYASLQHILNLRPDFIKLDIAMTRNIDRDVSRRALAAALVRFSRDTGSVVIAEGVEREGELAALGGLGIEMAQGYLLGRPVSPEIGRNLFA